jgi:predicted metalloprotease with PDZ domain
MFVGPNINLKTETRLCPVILSSNTDIIGISIQSDNDFGHIIMHVEPNSAADRAGIKTDDCIISVNNIVLIYKPFEDVLYFLKKSRHQSRLNFLLAKKSYLLQTSPNHSSSQSNIVQRNRSSTLPMTETREPLYQQYNHEQSTRNQKRDTIISITDEQYDTLSLQIYNNRYPTKHKKGHGKILRGIGPATAHRYSWSVASEKTVDYSSVTYDLYDRTPGCRN